MVVLVQNTLEIGWPPLPDGHGSVGERALTDGCRRGTEELGSFCGKSAAFLGLFDGRQIAGDSTSQPVQESHIDGLSGCMPSYEKRVDDLNWFCLTLVSEPRTMD
jgi:hypothetical protein